MRTAPVIMWFRQDLRLADNDALHAAAASGGPVIPVFVWSSQKEDPVGGAGRWWLHHSLASLDGDLRGIGSKLVLCIGDPVSVLTKMVEKTGADALFMNRRYEPVGVQIDSEVETVLGDQGVDVETFNSSLLLAPEQVLNTQGKPFQVFTPFWKACLAAYEPAPLHRAPKRLSSPKRWPATLRLKKLDLLPRLDWADGLEETWSPGERSAKSVLTRFSKKGLENYEVDRDRPDRSGTSRLSPHLHWGEIGPRQIWHALKPKRTRSKKKKSSGDPTPYLRQLIWREFAYHLLHHFPHTVDEPLREKFASFPWSVDEDALEAWQEGQTGYPLVDAGMRELWHTGWMHNRVRMVVASFLTKHLLIPWQEGAKWFADTLVDADLANNTFGWQWVAGCGADAAPFFRVFNPVVQGQKFDPDGDYVRHWVPELADLPDKWIHCPWQADRSVLSEAGVELGRDYPRPIVDHAEARRRALDAYDRFKTAGRPRRESQ